MEITLNGKTYDASAASEAIQQTIGRITVVDQELARIKNTFDITQIAKQALVNDIVFLLDKGDSGLVELESEETQEPEEGGE
jgi:hypothetical protein